MFRRTIVFGVATLALVAAPVVAAEADAKSANNTATSKSSKSQTKKGDVPTFTNADIDALPSNYSVLPSLDPAGNEQGPNRFVIIGTPAPEGEADTPAADATASPQTMEWVEQMLAERDRAFNIAAAQRRVRRAEAKVAEVERTYRPKGSPFSDGGGNTDRLFVRSVSGKTNKYDDAVRVAYLELAEARAELEGLLASGGAS